MTFLVYLFNPRAAMRRAAWLIDWWSRERWTSAQLQEIERAAMFGILVFVAVLLAALRVRG